MRRTNPKKAAGSAVALTLCLVGCGRQRDEAGGAPDAHRHELQRIRAAEEAMLASSGGRARPWAESSGSDPGRVEPWNDGYLGLLRSGELVHLDARGRPLDRVAAPAGASGWAFDDDSVVVVGVGEGVVARYSVPREPGGPGGPAELGLISQLDVEGSTGFRDIVLLSEGLALVSEPAAHRLATVDLASGELSAQRTCHGALGLQRVEAFIVANCLVDHELVVFALDGVELRERATIQHDGPIWGARARATPDGLDLVALGVEDHPLDRSQGFFGHVDSFAFAYRVAPSGRVRRESVFNLSAVGVVTPKSARFDGDAVVITGYGGDRLARITGIFDEPRAVTVSVPAGIAELAGTPQRGLAADPLLDAWISFDGGEWNAVPASDEPDPRSDSLRLGEALAFTTLMGPSNVSDGPMSRFTCETCHFEGRTDGRVHFTGRDDVHAATKTLRGLGANRPHFSRALDRSSTQMVNNEFNVVSKGTDQDPWFSLDLEDVPWVRELWAGADPTPVELREALLEFLFSFDPERNPWVGERESFNELERRGADAFADRCEHCHSARLITDDASTRVARRDWEREIFGAGSIKWASEDRVKTGIEPYVHDEGARPPSLRRLWVKFPYFTNGSSETLEDVLDRVRVSPDFSHAGGDGQGLPAAEREALRAFLQLL